MRAPLIALLGLAGVVILGYTCGLGVYAVTSTRPALTTQPTTVGEARDTIRALGLEAEYPFAHGFVETPHGRMHYAEAGAGAPVLCLHGNPTWSFLYRNFARELASDARVIAPDLIGFGLSQKLSRPDDYTIEGHVDDVSALVEQLDLRDMTLVMQDWGGPIGLGVALRHPDRVRALAIMNTIGFVPDGSNGFPLPLRVLRTPVLGEQLVQGFGVFNRVFVPAGIARPERRSELVRRAYDDVQGNWPERAGTLAFPRLLPTGPEDPVVPLLEAEDRYLAQFRGPVLIAWGMRDVAFGPDILVQWRERFPQAPVLELPDAGHYLQEDAWEEIVPAIRALLRQTNGTRPGGGDS